jgi:hypothetical protein
LSPTEAAGGDPAPGDPDPDPGPGAAAPQKRRSTYLRSGLVALGVVAVIGVLINFLLLQHRSPGVLDGQVVAQGISQALQYDADGHSPVPPAVRCPTSEPLRTGLRFDCTLGGSRPRTIVVTESNAIGSYTFRLAGPAGG